MQGHHLILGEITDFITGESLVETHDERYRQRIAQILVERKGYSPKEVWPRRELIVTAGEKRALIKIDYAVTIEERIRMIIKYGPGSLVTRERSALAGSRLLTGCQIPVVVVANGEDAHILNGPSGKLMNVGLDSIPSRDSLLAMLDEHDWRPISKERLKLESRIVYIFEIDGACPCDDTICHLTGFLSSLNSSSLGI